MSRTFVVVVSNPDWFGHVLADALFDGNVESFHAIAVEEVMYVRPEGRHGDLPKRSRVFRDPQMELQEPA